MGMKNSTKRPKSVKVSVLMPPALREALREKARRNLRSLSSEVVTILQSVAV
jgi:hypothetical protein